MKSFDLSSPEFNFSRYKIYKDLREKEPVYWYSDMSSWLITRHDDIMRFLKSDSVSTSYLVTDKLCNIENPDPSITEITNVIKTWMIYNDAPTHTRLRKYMNQVFFKENIQKVKPLIKELVKNRIADCDFENGFDFIKSFAHPIPAEILRIMIGLEDIELDKFLEWSDAIALFMQDFVVTPVPNAQIAKETAKSLLEMKAAFREAIERRKLNPQQDLLSGLVEALKDPASEITEEELVHQLIHLIFGGHKIPQFILGNTLHCLLSNQKIFRSLVENKEELIPFAIEEVMRYEAPIQYITRHAGEDISLHGKEIKKGDSIYLMLGSGNRDDNAFENPDIFNPIKRTKRHISFGGGIHVCIGAALVSEELKEIFLQFFQGVNQIQPLYDLENPIWTNNATFHGINYQKISVN